MFGRTFLAATAVVWMNLVVMVPLFAGEPPAARTSRAPVLPGSAAAQRDSAGPVFRLTERTDLASQQQLAGLTLLGPIRSNEHPLMPTVRWALQEMPTIERLQDYSAVLMKRERVNGKVGPYESLSVKIRHKPFSVYANFQAPASIKGQELIFVEGQNDGSFWAHRGVWGTMKFKPDSEIAMQGQRYPITEIGLLNLVRRLVEVGQQDINFGECEVKYFPGTKINGRSTTMIQVVHPQPRNSFRFHYARIFVDDDLKLPVRFESYDWPQEAGGAPQLMEEYTYLDLKLNNGFTDEDFSTKNPRYNFPPGP